MEGSNPFLKRECREPTVARLVPTLLAPVNATTPETAFHVYLLQGKDSQKPVVPTD